MAGQLFMVVGPSGVGKDTLDGSIECLAIRGMIVSFGNASGPLSDINVPKMLQPKGLYLAILGFLLCIISNVVIRRPASVVSPFGGTTLNILQAYLRAIK